jgi:hypothetical protein
MIEIKYRHEGEEKTFESADREESLVMIDKIMYVLKGAELISVTNGGKPVTMIRGW